MAPLPKSAWAKLPASQRGKWSYQKYAAWVNKTSARRSAARQQQSDAWGALAPTPNNVLLRQSRNEINAQTQPVIKDITQSINRQRLTGVADINHTTQQVLNALMPMAGQVGSVYDSALAEQHGIDDTLVNFLKGSGTSTQADVQGQLSAAGAPAGAGAGLADLGTGAAGMLLGYGSSTMSRLNADKATDVSYTSRLPGYAREQGAQRISDLEKTLGNDLADQVGQVSRQVPGMVQQSYQSLLEREYNKAVARKGFQMDQGKAMASSEAAAGTISPSVSSGMNDGFAHNKAGDYVYDQSGNPLPYSKKTPRAGAKGKDPVVRLDKVSKEAFGLASNLHKQMMGGLSDKNDPLGLKRKTPQAQASIVAHARENAVKQTVAYFKQHYPGKPDAWINQKAAGVLAAAGWMKGAQELGGAPSGAAPGVAPGTVSQSGKPVTGAKNTQLRLTQAVAGRAGVLAKNRTPEVAYAILVKYTLHAAHVLGFGLTQKEAEHLSQAALAQLGKVSNETPMGDPSQYTPTSTPSAPRKNKPSRSPGDLTPAEMNAMKPPKKSKPKNSGDLTPAEMQAMRPPKKKKHKTKFPTYGDPTPRQAGYIVPKKKKHG